MATMMSCVGLLLVTAAMLPTLLLAFTPHSVPNAVRRRRPLVVHSQYSTSPTPRQQQLAGTDDGSDPNGPIDAAVAAEATPRESSDGGPPPWMRCVNGVAPRTCALNEAVSVIASVSVDDANELISIGAVWARMDALTEEEILAQYGYGGEDDVASANVRYADFPKGWGGGGDDDVGDEGEEDLDEYVARMESRRYRRITTPSTIEAGTDVRVYPHPRRFPSCYEIDEDSKLYEDTTFLVVDKPPMLPTQPDASNYLECCPGCVNEILGPFTTIDGRPVVRPLLCHRVDSCVGGCVVLSKDGNGQRVFSELQRNRKLKKLYLAVTTEPVPLGRHIHWLWAPLNARGQMGGPSCQFVSHSPPASRRKARESWIRCVLEVTKCEPIKITPEDGHTYNPSDKQHYQSTIRLVTGRKHQVRAQLASLGCPIIRDTLYEPIAGHTLDKLGDEEDEMEESMDSAVMKCRVPTEPIGLQAHAILFGGIRAKARTPWWGDGS